MHDALVLYEVNIGIDTASWNIISTLQHYAKDICFI